MKCNERSLLKDMTWVMVVKLTALFALWWFCFAPEHKVRVDGSSVSSHFFDAAQPAPNEKERL